MIPRILNFLALASIKLFARTFYQVENAWLNRRPGEDPWKGMRLIVFLNHTSLFEPLLLGAAPWRMLWQMAGRIIAPGADVTMNRPIAGKLLKYVAPKMIPISRERDETWNHFMDAIELESVVIIAPEGRMMRENGLDKHGKPMSVRGGVADILELLETGEMVIVYSGGLHHVQKPGEGLPKLFKRIRLQCEKVNISEYITTMKQNSESSFRKSVIKNLESRMKKNVPKLN